jgi:threonylcarbamoyladenosine tRNA methylthiotransferase MtaB
MADKEKLPVVALDSIGCKLNLAEMDRLARRFAAAGYRLALPGDTADVYILNTCTVTHVADRKSRQRLRLAFRRHPGALIVATGCYAERAAAELAELGGIGLVADNREKDQLVELVARAGITGCPEEIPPFHIETGTRTRAFIPIQVGCNNACAYCIIPKVRGRAVSRSRAEIIAEVSARTKEGYREIVLTGTEIGAYDDSGVDLGGLLARILAETGIARLRISSLQPDEINRELLEQWRDIRLCRHFHLSLQSGSDSMLGRMRRRYSTGDYRRTVLLIREMLPAAAVTTDVIVGFPAETEMEFVETLEFCKEMRFSRIHVFPFSPRTGTEAAAMSGQVAEAVKKERSRRLIELGEAGTVAFRQRFLGETMTVLWEQCRNGVWSGLTDNYLRVYLKSRADLFNRLEPVRLVEPWRDGVLGKPAT